MTKHYVTANHGTMTVINLDGELELGSNVLAWEIDDEDDGLNCMPITYMGKCDQDVGIMLPDGSVEIWGCSGYSNIQEAKDDFGKG